MRMTLQAFDSRAAATVCRIVLVRQVLCSRYRSSGRVASASNVACKTRLLAMCCASSEGARRSNPSQSQMPSKFPPMVLSSTTFSFARRECAQILCSRHPPSLNAIATINYAVMMILQLCVSRIESLQIAPIIPSVFYEFKFKPVTVMAQSGDVGISHFAFL
jgi:hypothetical protein